MSNSFGAAFNMLLHSYLNSNTPFNVVLRRYITPAFLIFLTSMITAGLVDLAWLRWWLVYGLLCSLWLLIVWRPWEGTGKAPKEESDSTAHHEEPDLPASQAESESTKSQVEPASSEPQVSPESPTPRVWRFKRSQRKLSRDVLTMDDGTQVLEVHTEIKRREGLTTRRILSTARVTIIDNGFVEVDLLRRSNFAPIVGENEIHHFRRLDWISHGPLQLLVAIIGVSATFGATLYLGTWATMVVALLSAVIYWWVWMKWAYTYLILTDVRVQRIFDPPGLLAGTVDSSLLIKLVGAISKDPHWYTNLFRCGTLFSETAGQSVDAWIREGVEYVRDHHKVRDMMETLQLHRSA